MNTLSKHPEEVLQDANGPYMVTAANSHTGVPGHWNGFEDSCILSFLPVSEATAAADKFAWTIKAFEKEGREGKWSESRLDKPLTSAINLISTLDPHVPRDRNFHEMVFSVNGSTVEIGQPIQPHQFQRYMPWGTIITDGEEKAKRLSTMQTENERGFPPFDTSAFSRILCDAENTVPFGQRGKTLEQLESEITASLQSNGGVPTFFAKNLIGRRDALLEESQEKVPSYLNKILSSENAKPCNNTESHSYTFQGISMLPASEGKEIKYDRYIIQFIPSTSSIDQAYTKYCVEQFDLRETSEETEDRFNETLKTTLGVLSVLSKNNCQNVKSNYRTKNGFQVGIQDRLVANEESRLVILTDWKSGVGSVTDTSSSDKLA
ncbi:uncharacterized protein L201_000898 [Kwoniella dendrophila CBS 6074]|uniref:PD-(D/E)XK endonuclease-like domain-containing protein n=1 Tax=Kwoniella dendrophila CBS 6074 TaxID=1295534 RepID=A0AAX4JKV5_9TREE